MQKLVGASVVREGVVASRLHVVRRGSAAVLEECCSLLLCCCVVVVVVVRRADIVDTESDQGF